MRSFVVLPFLIFVGMTGYAMVKHNAWEVDRFTASVLGYAATTSALGAAFAVMLVVSPLVLQDAGSPYWLALRTGIVCAAFFPAYRAIKRRIDRAFFRTSRDAATVTETLRDLKQALHDAGPARGKEMIVEAAMTLDADRAQLWLADEAGARLVLASTRGDIDVRSALALDGELVRSLEGVRAGGIEGLAPDALPEAAQVALWERRLAMAAPIRAHGALGGFLGVGRKRSGTAYRVDELLFLAALAAEAGGLEQRERITSLFKRYLNPHVVDALLADPDQVSVRGERRRLSVLFVDLVDFTARAESSTPEDVLVFLNRYFDEAGATLAARGATLDKFVGDAIMCFWNAPLPQRDHETRACLAALDLVAVVARLDAELVAAGQRGVRCRVGVGTGECVVGTVGARDAQSYTAIGDPVNVASRLENLCTYYGTQTLITEDTVSGLSGAIVTREVDRLIVKGRRQPLRAFELLGPAGTVVGPSIAAYAHGLELYRAGDFTAAREVFRDHPDDGPSRLLAQRCEVFLAAPPPPDWEGTFAFDRK